MLVQPISSSHLGRAFRRLPQRPKTTGSVRGRAGITMLSTDTVPLSVTV